MTNCIADSPVEVWVLYEDWQLERHFFGPPDNETTATFLVVIDDAAEETIPRGKWGL